MSPTTPTSLIPNPVVRQTSFYNTASNTAVNSTNSWYTSAGTTSGTATYYAIAVPPGATQVNIPVFSPITAYPTAPSLRCDHSQYNSRTKVCEGCGQTAKDIFIRSTPPMAFNKYINASDLLEEFIQYLGENHVRKGEVFGLPVELFIKWLIIRACEEDKEEPDVVLQLPAPKSQPRCLGCRKYMKEQPLLLHGQKCSEFYFRRTVRVAA